jgi:hypothetical protein
LDRPAASGTPKLVTVTVRCTGAPTGVGPKSVPPGASSTGTGGPASLPCTVKRFVEAPPATPKALRTLPPVTVCGVIASPMCPGGGAGGAADQRRNCGLTLLATAASNGHGAAAHPTSSVKRPLPSAFVSTVALP